MGLKIDKIPLPYGPPYQAIHYTEASETLAESRSPQPPLIRGEKMKSLLCMALSFFDQEICVTNSVERRKTN